MIHIRFRPGHSTLSRTEFAALKQQVDRATPAHVQAYALTWAQPWRVDCMSITAAFAFGFSPRYWPGSATNFVRHPAEQKT
jgi:hypothetical protein